LQTLSTCLATLYQLQFLVTYLNPLEPIFILKSGFSSSFKIASARAFGFSGITEIPHSEASSISETPSMSLATTAFPQAIYSYNFSGESPIFAFLANIKGATQASLALI